MKNKLKWIANISVILNILFGIILWLTRSEWYKSQSAFAIADNVEWYYLMHLSGIVIFSITGYLHKRSLDYLVAFGLANILIFDMYDFPMLHDIATALTFTLAVFNMLYFASARTFTYNLTLGIIAAFFFILGLTPMLHLFLGESIAEGMIGISKLRQLNIKKDA